MKGTCWTCLAWLQPLFNFTASKYVFIKDWRLGVILRSLQVVIFAYVLTDIFRKASYLHMEVPAGYVTVWPDGLTIQAKADEIRKQQSELKAGNLAYCQDTEKYNFEWDGMEHDKFECAFLDPASLFVSGETQAFLTTHMRVEKMHVYSQDASGNCPAADDLGENYELIDGLEEACTYSDDRGYFPMMPEDVTLNVMHSYRTSSIVDKKGSLPRSIVRAPGFSDKEFVFESDHMRFKRPTNVILDSKQMKVTLRQLLSLVGIDLDKRLDEQENAPCRDPSQSGKFNNEDGQYPYARLSGMTLQVTFNYYTRKLAPKGWHKQVGDNSEEVVCLVDIVPSNKWTFLGSDIRQMMNAPADPILITPRVLEQAGNGTFGENNIISSQTDFQRNGVLILFSVSGSVGRFEMSALINALVAGSVLLSVAQAATTYMALYAFGISSELYRAFMRENVDWRQEYARYAAQACVAGYAFMQYDSNRSMKLDRKEVYEVLKMLMKKQKDMKDWQLAALADFLMRQGETGNKNVQKGRFNVQDRAVESYIDIVEWIDIFTEDKANWPALERLIKHEYKDEESQKGVMDLLTRSAEKRERALIPGVSFNEEEEDDGDIERDGTPMAPNAVTSGIAADDDETTIPLLEDPRRSESIRRPRMSM